VENIQDNLSRSGRPSKFTPRSEQCNDQRNRKKPKSSERKQCVAVTQSVKSRP